MQSLSPPTTLHDVFCKLKFLRILSRTRTHGCLKKPTTAAGYVESRPVLDFLNNLMRARNRVGRGLLYRPARLLTQAYGIDSLELILALLKSLKIRALSVNFVPVKCGFGYEVCLFWNVANCLSILGSSPEKKGFPPARNS
jgi:hypothetical protein